MVLLALRYHKVVMMVMAIFRCFSISMIDVYTVERNW